MNWEEIKGLIIFCFIVFVSFKVLEWFLSWNNIKRTDNNRNYLSSNSISDDKMKLFKTLDNEKLKLENLVIKYEEIEWEISDLDFESSTNLELEWKNNLKIRKLDLQLKHLAIKIEEKNQEINNLNNEIVWIQ